MLGAINCHGISWSNGIAGGIAQALFDDIPIAVRRECEQCLRTTC